MEGVNGLITDGFAEVTTVVLVVAGAAFTLTALVIAVVMGIGWMRKVAKKS